MLKKDKVYGIQTQAIHAGEIPDPTTGASAPNIAMSTTYVVTDASAQFSANALGDDAPFVYCRWSNPTVKQLEMKLAALEHGARDPLAGGDMHADDRLGVPHRRPQKQVIVVAVA